MDGGVGSLIQQWRLAQRLSLRSLAAKANVSHTTLGRWETGRFQPCLPELEATLHALNASPQQRRQALERLDAPRAVLQVQRETHDLFAWQGDKLPSGGDLLCAMRRRRHKTQAEIAAQAGITASTLCRWERGENWPAPSELQTLCYLLEASEEEMIALTMGRFALKGEDEELSLEVLEERIEAMRWSSVARNEDLKFLTLEAQLWHCAGQNPAARNLFVAFWAYRADYLSWWERFEEAGNYARRALELKEKYNAVGKWRLYAGIADARAQVYQGQKPAPRRGIETLRLWLPEVTDRFPAYEAWMLSDLAKYAALDGNQEMSLSYSAKAFQVAQRAIAPREAFFRGYDHAALLLQSHRVQEALPLLEEVPENRPQYVRPLLTAAETSLAMGNALMAQHYLERATQTVADYQIEHLLPLTDVLNLRLSAA